MPRLSPAAYRKITFVAVLLLAAIIVTGGAVRLTQSGLGCPDWPNCSAGHLVPHGASDSHGWIEYVNRLFTGAVSIVVIVAVLGSLARVPRRKDLLWLSIGLVLGVLAQIVLGALTVAVRPPAPVRDGALPAVPGAVDRRARAAQTGGGVRRARASACRRRG